MLVSSELLEDNRLIPDNVDAEFDSEAFNDDELDPERRSFGSLALRLVEMLEPEEL